MLMFRRVTVHHVVQGVLHSCLSVILEQEAHPLLGEFADKLGGCLSVGCLDSATKY